MSNKVITGGIAALNKEVVSPKVYFVKCVCCQQSASNVDRVILEQSSMAFAADMHALGWRQMTIAVQKRAYDPEYEVTGAVCPRCAPQMVAQPRFTDYAADSPTP